MLIDEGCSIYNNRPQTCREFDCRIYAAADLILEEENQAAINTRVQSWQFRIDSSTQDIQQLAIPAAARFIKQEAAHLQRKPSHPTEIALLAIAAWDLFVGHDNIPVQDQATQTKALIEKLNQRFPAHD